MTSEFWKDKRVFITGHTGFKGSWLSLWLEIFGAKVYGYALFPPTEPNMFDMVHVDSPMKSTIGDTRDYQSLLNAIKEANPEIVIHMAAQPLVRQSYADPIETYQTNVIGTVNLLEAIRTIGSVKAAINVTSDKCYENREWLWAYRECDSLGGYDPYSSSKACSELVTSAFQRSFFSNEEKTVALASARAGNVIGGGDWATDRLIPDCIKAWTAGKAVEIRYPQAIRPWQHVLEPLSGYLILAEKLFCHGKDFAQAWNFGPDETNVKNVEEIITMLADAWGDNAKWKITGNKKQHEAGILKLDCSKARKKIHWMPCWGIQKTIEEIAKWYKICYEKPNNIREFTIKQINQYMEDRKCIQ